MMRQCHDSLFLLLLAVSLLACGDESGGDGNPGGTDGLGEGAEIVMPEHYVFETDTCDDAPCSTVSYTGQTHRQVLMLELKAYISAMTADIDSGLFMPAAPEEVVDALDFYFRFDADSDGATSLTLSADLPLFEQTFADISNKDLVGKLAGNDPVTDHQDWTVSDNGAPSMFGGWPGVDSPEELVVTFFTMLGENAVARANGAYDHDVYLTVDGHDLNQLIQKFLTMAVTFSQGTDDYLDNDVLGKGLLSSNVVEEGDSYSGLAHAWDEAFGYFGAARDYSDYTDEEIAGKGGRDEFQGAHDSDEDETLSLTSEYNFAASVNAAKRDLGSAESAPTDFTQTIFDAFLAGRHLIATTEGELTADQQDELVGYRDAIVAGWEKVFAATAVHYINDVLADMSTMGTDDYDFATHAKHWSELKGFSLGFQFNPHSMLSDEDFGAYHDLVGTAPVLSAAGDELLAAYKEDLLAARGLLQTAYGFADANMGDTNGDGGW